MALRFNRPTFYQQRRLFRNGLLNRWSMVKRGSGSTAALSVGSVVMAVMATVILLYHWTTWNDVHRVMANEPHSMEKPKMGIYREAAVAADNGLCSVIGRDMLLKNGSVVDAILATSICQGATNSHASGVGGGFILTYYDRASRKCTVIDARETASAAATQKLFANMPELSSSEGMLAVATPGDVHGMWTAHKKFGKLPWEELFTPTIELCQNGFPVTGAFAKAITVKKVKRNIRAETGLDFLINPATKQYYKKGEILKRPLYAQVLRNLSRSSDPVKMFYEGYIARSLVREIRDGGGIVDLDDFKNYRSQISESRELIKMRLGNDLVLCGPPPPAGAIVVAAILGILRKFNLTLPSHDSNPTLTYHRMIESFKFGYGIYSKLGDPNFEQSVAKVTKKVLSENWINDTWRKIGIRSKSSIWDYIEKPRFVKEDHGTTHISAVDANNNAASLTASLHSWFGSKRRSKSTGIILNNQMHNFAIPGLSLMGMPPASENFIKPNKRTRSSMCPIIIFNSVNGIPRLVIGAAGSSKIITSVVYVTTLILWLGLSPKEALDAPRLHDRLIENVTHYEKGFPLDIIHALESFHGQKLRPMPSHYVAAVTAIERRNNKLYCTTDKRKQGGYTAGF